VFTKSDANDPTFLFNGLIGLAINLPLNYRRISPIRNPFFWSAPPSDIRAMNQDLMSTHRNFHQAAAMKAFARYLHCLVGYGQRCKLFPVHF
jgi:hypothetical protein